MICLLNGKPPHIFADIKLRDNSSYLFWGVVIYLFIFLKVYFIDYAITVVPVFLSPLFPSILLNPSFPQSPCPPLFMSMGHTYKFFGFYISYAILNLPLSIFYLPFMLLILCTFPPSLPLPLPC